jgi:predicted ATP-grasp superfamily ATP-dependent carboligase
MTQGDPYPEITPSSDAPWVAQEWLEGKSFCTFSICHKGKVHAHSTYPVDFTIQKKGRLNSTVGSYCMTFKSIEHEAILGWVQNFIKKIRYSGLIAFDFIELANGDLYAIECNPRITSGITLFSNDSNLDKALFGTNSELIAADPSIEKQITPGMILYGWRSAITCKKLPLFFSRLFRFKDLVFQKNDPLPFFAQAFLWLKHSYDIMLYKKRLHGAFTHDLDFDG